MHVHSDFILPKTQIKNFNEFQNIFANLKFKIIYYMRADNDFILPQTQTKNFNEAQNIVAQFKIKNQLLFAHIYFMLSKICISNLDEQLNLHCFGHSSFKSI